MALHHLFLVLLLAVIAAASSDVTIDALAGKSKNLIIGKREQGDHLLQSEVVTKGANFYGVPVTILKTLGDDSQSVITEVRALDQHTNGHGASVKLVAGGPGRVYVTLQFKSEWFRGIDFIVEVYGK